jgi:hypothetical protein
VVACNSVISLTLIMGRWNRKGNELDGDRNPNFIRGLGRSQAACDDLLGSRPI